MDETQSQSNESSLVELPQQRSYIADKTQPTVSLTKLLNDMGLAGVRVPASELIDRKFLIVRAKPFQSAYNEEAHAWFCVCIDPDINEVFTTVLGGKAVVDILDALTATGIDNPLEVTLRQVKGGRYGKYYVLE
jgi:hypothetical protein